MRCYEPRSERNTSERLIDILLSSGGIAVHTILPIAWLISVDISLSLPFFSLVLGRHIHPRSTHIRYMWSSPTSFLGLQPWFPPVAHSSSSSLGIVLVLSLLPPPHLRSLASRPHPQPVLAVSSPSDLPGSYSTSQLASPVVGSNLVKTPFPASPDRPSFTSSPLPPPLPPSSPHQSLILPSFPQRQPSPHPQLSPHHNQAEQWQVRPLAEHFVCVVRLYT
jgi:hypothetical protein